MEKALLVGAGGFLGSIGRYLLDGRVHRALPDSLFPWGTLAVNALGCLAIGFLGGLVDAGRALGPEARLFLLIGVLGGFTTFSSFAYETLALARDAETARAGANVLLNVALSLGGAYVGLAASRAVS